MWVWVRLRARYLTALILSAATWAQVGGGRTQPPLFNNGQLQVQSDDSTSRDVHAEAELQTGTALTRKGLFQDAIPHLLAARGHVANEYAASFNLALCYVATHEFQSAIRILEDLRRQSHANADVENLLAQAYIGDGQRQPALASLQRASTLTPSNEKLYLFVADACMDARDYALGLKVADLGLEKLPNSAALHYQRGMFLSSLDEFDQATEDFHLAERLAPGSEISYLAGASQAFYAGNPGQAARLARDGIGHGFENPALLRIFGDALMRSGVRPGDAEFAEAESSLLKAVAMRPGDAKAQAALGKLYVLADRPADAITHLEKARDLEPDNPSIYANLAKAYQRHGDEQRARDALAKLAKLNQAQAEKIGSAPGERKRGYSGSGLQQSETTGHR